MHEDTNTRHQPTSRTSPDTTQYESTAEAVASVPLKCEITVQGYKADNEVAEQKFKFDPALLAVSAEMEKAKLNDKFKHVDEFST